MTEYKMVPVEPTEEKINAPKLIDWLAQNNGAGQPSMRDYYTAMIAAAPPAPVVRIKPLEWVDSPGLGKRKITACHFFGGEFARLDYDANDSKHLMKIEQFKREKQSEYEARIRSALVSPPATSPDDAAVDRFAAAMKEKLARKRAEGRGGWDDPEQCSAEFLSRLLRDHVDKGDPMDVGNLAMMLHQRGKTIASAPSPEREEEPMSEISETRIAEIREQVKSYSREPWLRQDCIDILAALDAARVGDMRDAYVGAREDLLIWKKRALAAEAERDDLKEKLADAQSYFTRANADVGRIVADTDRVWGSMPVAVEKIAKLEAERDRMKAALAEAVAALQKLDRRGDALETFDIFVHEIVNPALATARAALAQEPS
jgi:hypothetical protein